MLARHMLLSGSKQGYESGGRLETLLSSPAVMLGGVGITRFGVLEWREPLVLVSIVDQLRSGVLSMGSAKGLDVGWACCHLDQQIVSTIPAWILLGEVQFGVRQLWSGSCLYLLSQSWAVCTSQKRGFVHAVPVVLTGQVRGL